jgi:hypothetical protein
VVGGGEYLVGPDRGRQQERRKAASLPDWHKEFLYIFFLCFSKNKWTHI